MAGEMSWEACVDADPELLTIESAAQTALSCSLSAL